MTIQDDVFDDDGELVEDPSVGADQDMSSDAAGLKFEVTFFYVAKFNGDPKPKADGISKYDALCQDLLNPQCVEIRVGGKDLVTQVWSKSCP
jgi:hypothetical protein